VDSVLVQMMTEILKPLPEAERAKLLGWIGHEVENRPVVAFCNDEEGQVWKLGCPSPLDQTTTVIALLPDYDRKVVGVYAMKSGKTSEGAELVQFFREVIWRPKHMQGPISHRAMFVDLRDWLLDEHGVAADICQELAERLEGEKEGSADAKVLMTACKVLSEYAGDDVELVDEDAGSHANGAAG